jgi:outer membrane lipoprotein-sorting protein
MSSLIHSRRIRWLAPVVVIAAIGLLAFVPTISASADTPTLPPLTAQALLAKVQAAKAASLPGLSGTIKLSTNLGIPNLSELGGVGGGGNAGFNPTDLLSGVHSADVWASKDGFRATYSDSSTSEDDVITNGKDLWTWESRGTKVTHVVLPAKTDKPTSKPDDPETASGVKTPDQVAESLLSSLSPSTDVSVSSPVYVANHRAAYQLILAPKANSAGAAASTVDHITVAVDEATSLPIRVQIFARGQPAAAFDFGFSKLNIGAQNPNRFTFSPPPGAKVTTKVLSGDHPDKPAIQPSTPTGTGPTVVGHDWTTVYVFHQAQMPRRGMGGLFRAATVLPNGQGRVLTTALVNVLFLNNGDIAVGAVNAGALQAAAASAG